MRRLLIIITVLLAILLSAGVFVYHTLQSAAQARLEDVKKALPANVQLTWKRAEPGLLMGGVTLHHVTLRANGAIVRARIVKASRPAMNGDAFTFSTFIMQEPVVNKADLQATAQTIVFRNLKVSPVALLRQMDDEKVWDKLVAEDETQNLTDQQKFANILQRLFDQESTLPALNFRKVHVLDLHIKHIFPADSNDANVSKASLWDALKGLRIDEGSFEGYGVGQVVHLNLEGLNVQMKRCGAGEFEYPIPAKMTVSVDRFAGHSGANLMELGEHEETEEFQGWHFRNNPAEFVKESPGVIELKGLNLNCKPYVSQYGDFNVTAQRAFIQREMKTNPIDYSHKAEFIVKRLNIEDPRIPEVLQNAITYPVDLSLKSTTESTEAVSGGEPVWITNLQLDARARNADRLSLSGPVMHTGSLLEDLGEAPYTWSVLGNRLADLHWGKFDVTMSGEDFPNTIYAFFKALTPSEADRMGVLTLSTLHDYAASHPSLGTVAQWLHHPQGKVLELKTDAEQLITNKRISSLPAPAFVPDLPIEAAKIH